MIFVCVCGWYESVFIHTYIHTHMHTYIHTYIHTYTHTNDQEAWDAFRGGDGERRLEHAAEYAEGCKAVAEATSCPCVDLFSEMHKVAFVCL